MKRHVKASIQRLLRSLIEVAATWAADATAERS